MSTDPNAYAVRETLICAKCGTMLIVRTLELNGYLHANGRLNVRSGCCNHYVVVTTEVCTNAERVFNSDTYPKFGGGGGTLQDQLAQARQRGDEYRDSAREARGRVEQLSQEIEKLKAAQRFLVENRKRLGKESKPKASKVKTAGTVEAPHD